MPSGVAFCAPDLPQAGWGAANNGRLAAGQRPSAHRSTTSSAIDALYPGGRGQRNRCETGRPLNRVGAGHQPADVSRGTPSTDTWDTETAGPAPDHAPDNRCDITLRTGSCHVSARWAYRWVIARLV